VLVFISYAHEDSSLVDEVAQRLSSAGLELFRDIQNISWGGRISFDVQKALEQAGGVVVIVSPASVKSHWVHYEIGYATALRKPILPFLTHPSIDLPGYLADLRHISKLDEITTFIGQVTTTGQASVVDISGRLSDAARVATRLSELPRHMAGLLSEMQRDLQSDETGLVMEFIVLSSRGVCYTYYKRAFRYYEEEIPDLRLMIDRLQDMDFIIPVSTGNFPIYRMKPDFVAALRGAASPPAMS
jgi:hypothetical protein